MPAGSLPLSGTWTWFEMLKGSFEMNPGIQGVPKVRRLPLQHPRGDTVGGTEGGIRL